MLSDIRCKRSGNINIFADLKRENMSIYEILPALDLTQSVHAKISISRIPLIGLDTRLG
jgi:hypothetical protein